MREVPAEAATTPLCRCSDVSRSKAFRAPRSLKLFVNARRYGNVSKSEFQNPEHPAFQSAADNPFLGK